MDNNNQNDWNNGRNDWNNHQPGWNGGDSSNNPYYNQPTYNPYKKQAFATASVVLGILSLMSSCMGILSIPLAALSILFAILACRKGKRMNPMAVSGLAMACVGIVSGIVIAIRSFTMLPDMMQDPAYRQQMDNLSQALYGRSFEELLKEAYGIEIGE